MIDIESKGIVIIDDVFDSDNCRFIIDYFNNKPSDDIFTRKFPKLKFLTIVPHWTHVAIDTECHDMVSDILYYSPQDVNIQRAHIELREEGAYMDYHLDITNPTTAFTSVTYLNDDFEGGNTVIRPHGENTDRYDTVIVPKAGRTVYFNGMHYYHRVTEVQKGDRYTLPIWYMREQNATI